MNATANITALSKKAEGEKRQKGKKEEGKKKKKKSFKSLKVIIQSDTTKQFF